MANCMGVDTNWSHIAPFFNVGRVDAEAKIAINLELRPELRIVVRRANYWCPSEKKLPCSLLGNVSRFVCHSFPSSAYILFFFQYMQNIFLLAAPVGWPNFNWPLLLSSLSLSLKFYLFGYAQNSIMNLKRSVPRNNVQYTTKVLMQCTSSGRAFLPPSSLAPSTSSFVQSKMTSHQLGQVNL